MDSRGVSASFIFTKKAVHDGMYCFSLNEGKSVSSAAALDINHNKSFISPTINSSFDNASCLVSRVTAFGLTRFPPLYGIKGTGGALNECHLGFMLLSSIICEDWQLSSLRWKTMPLVQCVMFFPESVCSARSLLSNAKVIKIFS